MDKELFADLLQSVKDMDKIMRGEMAPSRVFVVEPRTAVEPDTVDARAARAKTGLSQSEFARLIGVKVKTLQNWEQRRRTPSGPAAALLTLASKAPEVVLETLHA